MCLPQCVPNGTVPIRSRTRTFRLPAIATSFTDIYHDMPHHKGHWRADWHFMRASAMSVFADRATTCAFVFVRGRPWVGPTGYRSGQNRETQIKHWGAPWLDLQVARAGSLAGDQQRWFRRRCARKACPLTSDTSVHGKRCRPREPKGLGSASSGQSYDADSTAGA